MTKPIFLIGLPQMASIEQIEEIQKNLEQKLEQSAVSNCEIGEILTN